jgi:hypothetical protein
MLIYGLYYLFPERLRGWHHVELPNESNILFNITAKSMTWIIIHVYKTKQYEQQDFSMDDKDLNHIINEYMLIKDLKEKDHLFHLERNDKQIILQPIF